MSTESQLISNAVITLVREAGGTIADRVFPGRTAGTDFTVREPESLAGARAAQLLGWAARRALLDYVQCARVDGHSWQVIGEKLGYGGRAEEDSGYPAAVSVFRHVTADTAASFAWTCPACRQVVIDFGPGHPADAEHGHAEGCERLAATVAAWEEEDGDE